MHCLCDAGYDDNLVSRLSRVYRSAGMLIESLVNGTEDHVALSMSESVIRGYEKSIVSKIIALAILVTKIILFPRRLKRRFTLSYSISRFSLALVTVFYDRFSPQQE